MDEVDLELTRAREAERSGQTTSEAFSGNESPSHRPIEDAEIIVRYILERLS
jgi:hypothetical protein